MTWVLLWWIFGYGPTTFSPSSYLVHVKDWFQTYHGNLVVGFIWMGKGTHSDMFSYGLPHAFEVEGVSYQYQGHDKPKMHICFLTAFLLDSWDQVWQEQCHWMWLPQASWIPLWTSKTITYCKWAASNALYLRCPFSSLRKKALSCFIGSPKYNLKEKMNESLSPLVSLVRRGWGWCNRTSGSSWVLPDEYPIM